MINIEKIVIKNFISFDYAELIINNKGCYLVTGINKDSNISNSNGSGKSALFVDSILYAIYGKFDRQLKKKGKDTCFVELHFNYNNIDYIIKRYYNDNVYKNSIEIYQDGNKLEFHTKKDVQLFINNIFKMSYDNFISSIVFKQGFDVKLTTLTPTKRKDFFSSIVDIDIDKVYKKVKVDIQVIENDYNVIKDKYNDLKIKLSNLEGRLQSKLSILEQHTEDIDILSLSKEIKELIKIKNEKEQEYINLKEEKDKLYSDYISKISNAKFKYNQLKKLKSGVCPLCGSKVSKKEELKNKLKELEKIINTKFEYDKENYLNELQNDIINLNNLINSKKVELSKLIFINKSKISISSDIDKLNEEINKLKIEIDKIENELINYEIKLEQYKGFLNLLKPSGKIRTIFLENYINIYNSILYNISSQFFDDITNIKLEIKEDYSGIDISGVDYKSLSGGEKRRLDFVLQLAYADFIRYINKFDINIRVIDEIFDNLDANTITKFISFVKDLFSDKSIFIITHNENVKSIVDYEIKVVKENGNSYIQTLDNIIK